MVNSTYYKFHHLFGFWKKNEVKLRCFSGNWRSMIFLPTAVSFYIFYKSRSGNFLLKIHFETDRLEFYYYRYINYVYRWVINHENSCLDNMMFYSYCLFSFNDFVLTFYYDGENEFTFITNIDYYLLCFQFEVTQKVWIT